MTLKKINILEYAFGEGGGGHQKAYAVYAFKNVDNCERPLTVDVLHCSISPQNTQNLCVEVNEIQHYVYQGFEDTCK